IIGGIIAISYYIYESINFFSTQDAQVTADTVTITPEITGKLKEWNVSEGDFVKNGQILGRQDLSDMVTSTAQSPQTLNNSADALVAKADIKSPIDGKVVQSNVITGQVISPGLEIATIADTAHMYIKANIEETDILHIKTGQKVDIKIDAYPHRTFTGTVESIGQATNSAFSQMPSLNTSGTYSKVTQLIPVHISINNTENLTLMLGMNATIKIHIN
ncbi:MAG TPA: efflux RND transporter periplasmic adaptor subunit, partial [Syntrophomonadaceae bacterium]|nr:efflux RND transporter periplasmic adaptor subunit [Syntrophomonadaceae bacterium]